MAEGDLALKAKATLDAATREYERASALVESGAISRKEFEQAELDYINAKAAFQAYEGRSAEAVSVFLSRGELADTAVFMLRLQVAGMAAMAVVLLCQIIFQASGKTGSALALSVSRQGVVFAAALFVCIRLWGYHGIVAAQLLADCLSALLALALLRLTFRTDPVLGRGETNC